MLLIQPRAVLYSGFLVVVLLLPCITNGQSRHKAGAETASPEKYDWADQVVEDFAKPLLLTIDKMPEAKKKDTRVRQVQEQLVRITNRCKSGRYDHGNYELELVRLEKLEKKLDAVTAPPNPEL